MIIKKKKNSNLKIFLCYRFDLKNTNVNDDNLEKMAVDKIPDVVLVKKVYAEKSLRLRRRYVHFKIEIDLVSATPSAGAEAPFTVKFGYFLTKNRQFGTFLKTRNPTRVPGFFKNQNPARVCNHYFRH